MADDESSGVTEATPVQPEPEVIAASGLMEIKGALANAAEKHGKGAPVLVVGIVRSPATKCWQVCISQNGAPVTWVSAHRRRRDAEGQIKLIRQVGKQSGLNRNDLFDRLLDELSGQSEAELQAISNAPPQLRNPRSLWNRPKRL